MDAGQIAQVVHVIDAGYVLRDGDGADALVAGCCRRGIDPDDLG
jgi:hypothetical protein